MILFQLDYLRIRNNRGHHPLNCTRQLIQNQILIEQIKYIYSPRLKELLPRLILSNPLTSSRSLSDQRKQASTTFEMVRLFLVG